MKFYEDVGLFADLPSGTDRGADETGVKE